MNTSLIAELILGVLALALLLAAAYALFGRPSSAKGRKRQREIANGFTLAGGIVLGIVLGASLVGGIGTAFFGLHSQISSKPIAFIVAAAAFYFIAFFVQRWAKYFAGWMAWSVLNALMMASSGHLVNNPSVLVPRSVALTMAGLMVVTALASVRFGKGRKLNIVDKTALLLWVLAFAVGANTVQYMLLAVSLGCAGLIVASLYDRRSRREAVTGSHRLR